MNTCQGAFDCLLAYRERLEARFPPRLRYRVMTHVCLNGIRDHGRRPKTCADDPLLRVASSDKPSGRSGAQLMLDRLFGTYPLSSRASALMRYLDGLTLEQVTAVLGLSTSSVRDRLRGLRHMLRHLAAASSRDDGPARAQELLERER